MCTIVGSPRAELIRGTSHADFICGAGGRDRIDPGPGADVIYGHGTILGGAGGDRVLVAGGDWQRQPGLGRADPFVGRSVVQLGLGDDFAVGLAGSETVFGGPGNDIVEGGEGNDRLLGQAGKDDLSGQADADVLDGGGGDDSLAGHAGDDVVRGGPGDDLVLGGYFNSSNERLSPGGGDRLSGGPGRDRLAGGKGHDRVDGGPGPDDLSGGSGNDLLLAADGWADVVDGNRGSDRARVDTLDRVARVERVSRR